MAIKIESKKVFSYFGAIDEKINSSRNFLLFNDFKISGETAITNGYSIYAKRGSETALRILGALFTTQKQLPIKIGVQIFQSGQIQILLSSNIVGLGISLGLNHKFNNCFTTIFDLYQNMLSEDNFKKI